MATPSPVLFIVFNRPDTTQRVFEAIRRARPPRLYVAADGPRRPDEEARCAAVRRIATAVDWPCELVTLMRAENLGCRRAVSTAITWFFEHEPEGIILEDDCLPEPSFFSYCAELLERHRDDPRVMCVSGVNFISDHLQPVASYYFSVYANIWGWATWRRAWQHYDVDMAAWQQGGRRALLEQMLPHQLGAQTRWRCWFDRAAGGRLNAWSYQWVFACWRHGALSCVPGANLISNIGFGEGATHTVKAGSKLANRSVSPIGLPLRHPGTVAPHVEADRWSSEHVMGISERRISLSLWRRVIRNWIRDAFWRLHGWRQQPASVPIRSSVAPSIKSRWLQYWAAKRDSTTVRPVGFEE